MKVVEQNMGRRRERIYKGKSTFVEIQGDISWAGWHKLLVSFGGFHLFSAAGTGGIQDATARGSEPVQ